MVHGKIKCFDGRRGFGFVTVDGLGEAVFFHRICVRHRDQLDELEPGQDVEFELVSGSAGLRAEDVARIEHATV